MQAATQSVIYKLRKHTCFTLTTKKTLGNERLEIQKHKTSGQNIEESCKYLLVMTTILAPLLATELIGGLPSVWAARLHQTTSGSNAESFACFTQTQFRKNVNPC